MGTRPTSLLGSWEGMRSVQAAGWQWGGVGTMGSDCLPRLGTPPGFGVFIPTVYLWQGLTPPFPQQVLPPRWQLWSCPCDQGHSLGVLSGYRHRTPGGTDPPTQLPSPLQKQVSASREHPMDPCCPRPLCPHRTRWSVSVSLSPAAVPRVTLSRPSPPCAQRSPRTSQAAADGGGDICLRVTHLTVAVSPLLPSPWMGEP